MGHKGAVSHSPPPASTESRHVLKNLNAFSERPRIPHDVTANILWSLAAPEANKNTSKRTPIYFRVCLHFTTRAFRRRTGRKLASYLRHSGSCLRHRPLRAHLSSFSRFLEAQAVARSPACTISRHRGRLKPLRVSVVFRTVLRISGADLGCAWPSGGAYRKRPLYTPSCCRCPSTGGTGIGLRGRTQCGMPGTSLRLWSLAPDNA